MEPTRSNTSGESSRCELHEVVAGFLDPLLRLRVEVIPVLPRRLLAAWVSSVSAWEVPPVPAEVGLCPALPFSATTNTTQHETKKNEYRRANIIKRFISIPQSFDSVYLIDTSKTFFVTVTISKMGFLATNVLAWIVQIFNTSKIGSRYVSRPGRWCRQIQIWIKVL